MSGRFQPKWKARVLGNLSAKTVDDSFQGIVVVLGIPGVNDSCERLFDVYAGRELCTDNLYFRKKDIQWCIRVSGFAGDTYQWKYPRFRGIIRKLVGKNVQRAEARDLFDHYIVVTKLTLQWESRV